MSESATIPLWDAWGVAIEAGENAPPELLEPRFYRGAVKGTPSAGYFLFGQVIAPNGSLMNGQDGEDIDGMIHCWAATPDGALKLYRWLKPLLHNVPLAVAGFGLVSGVLSMTGPVPGPIVNDKVSGWQVFARYVAEPVEV